MLSPAALKKIKKAPYNNDREPVRASLRHTDSLKLLWIGNKRGALLCFKVFEQAAPPLRWGVHPHAGGARRCDNALNLRRVRQETLPESQFFDRKFMNR